MNISSFFLTTLLITLCTAILPANGASQPSSVQAANLAEDVALLSEELGRLRINLQNLQRENDQLKQQIAAVNQRRSESEAKFYTQVAEVRKEILAIQQNVQSVVKTNNEELLKHFGQQVERLGTRVQSTVNQLKSTEKEVANSEIVFSDDYSKEGVIHVIEKGDTLSHIAVKYHTKIADIQNANRIADPKNLKPGQTLFVPQKVLK